MTADVLAMPDTVSNAAYSARRRTGLTVLSAILLIAVAASLMVGARTIAPGDVLSALLHGGSGTNAVVVRDLRVPRTLIGLVVGLSLAMSGALMQALTSNPLADPGLLGVSAGSSAAIVVGIGVFGVTSASGYVWFALAGAALASLIVYGLGAHRRLAAGSAWLALAGAAVTAALLSGVRAMTLLKPSTFDTFRFWVVGSLSGQPLGALARVAPFAAVGVAIAAVLARRLNTLALGDELCRALGVRPGRTRALGAIAVVLLAGSATAAAGPIGFVGLVVPHAIRSFTGPDERWVLAYAAVAGPVLVLVADVIGRVVAPPGEVQVGIGAALIGAPVFIGLIRRRVVKL